MGQREGAAGLTTHAPQAAQAVTLPTTLDEAVAALTAVPAAVPVAGGTDLMASVNSGQLRPAALVGLGRISEIRGWQYQDGHALLGAGLTHARMGRPDFAALIPALAAAARAAGPPHIRNAGTLGGNIASAAPTGDALRSWRPWRRH
ncbi:oxidoreductase [Streptomyces purpurascens]